MELRSGEKGVDFPQGPDERHALPLRQELEVPLPRRRGSAAPLVHESHDQAKTSRQTGALDHVARAGGPDGEARALRDGGHEVPFRQVADGPHRDSTAAFTAGVVELQGVAAIDAVGSHPSLEGPQSPDIEEIKTCTTKLCIRVGEERRTGSSHEASAVSAFGNENEGEDSNV